MTNYEVHSFRDTWGRGVVGKNDRLADDKVEARFNYLASTRFLDRIPHRVPLWRNLHLEEATISMLRAKTGGSKSPDQDTVLLNAARRAIAEQVPGLVHYFVTGDTGMARLATQILPRGATLAAYMNGMRDAESYLVPYAWLPGPNEGYVRTSNLASFLYECLCLCDKVELTVPSGHRLTVWGYEPDQNQYPSTWNSVWVEEHMPLMQAAAPPGPEFEQVALGLANGDEGDGDAAPGLGSSDLQEGEPMTGMETAGELRRAGRAGAPPDARGFAQLTIAATRARTRKQSTDTPIAQGQESERFPLVEVRPLQDGERKSIPTCFQLISGFNAVIAAVSSGTEDVKLESLEFAERARKELRFTLQSLRLLQRDDDKIGASAVALYDAFGTSDLVALTNFVLQLKAPRQFLEALAQSGSIEMSESLGMGHYSADNGKALLRVLGQAVEWEGRLYYGGAAPREEDFLAWLERKVDELIASEPAREAPLSKLALAALIEQSVSPLRLSAALRFALEHRLGRQFEPTRGGTPTKYLNERVVTFGSNGIELADLSADGLLGYRTLKRKHA